MPTNTSLPFWQFVLVSHFTIFSWSVNLAIWSTQPFWQFALVSHRGYLAWSVIAAIWPGQSFWAAERRSGQRLSSEVKSNIGSTMTLISVRLHDLLMLVSKSLKQLKFLASAKCGWFTSLRLKKINQQQTNDQNTHTHTHTHTHLSLIHI